MIQNYQSRKVKMKVSEAIQRIRRLSAEEKCEVENALNCWEWDERMGEKPKNWNRLKNSNDFPVPMVTKFSYIKPLLDYLTLTVGRKKFLQWHHMHNLGRTEKEFEEWWEKHVTSQSAVAARRQWLW